MNHRLLQNRPVAVKSHPLKGALNQRIKLFERLATHNGARPPRVYEMGTIDADAPYSEAPDGVVV